MEFGKCQAQAHSRKKKWARINHEFVLVKDPFTNLLILKHRHLLPQTHDTEFVVFLIQQAYILCSRHSKKGADFYKSLAI